MRIFIRFFIFLFQVQRDFDLRIVLYFVSLGEIEQASSPPRGWNSYDSFCWTISEEEFLQNAERVSQRLRVHGYEVFKL